MIDKLKRRFIFVVMALFTGLLVLVLSCIYLFMAQSEARQSVRILEDTLRPMGQENGRFFSDRPEKGSFGQSEGTQKNNFLRNTILLELDAEGTLTDIRYQFEAGEVDQAALEAAAERILAGEKEKGSMEIASVSYRYLRRAAPEGAQIALLDRSIELATLQRLLLILLLIGAGAWLVFLLVSIFLARWAIRPTAESWERQRRFIADASHELKTPLTVIDANLDVVLANPQEPVASQAKWLQYCKTECARMSKLVHELLFLAKSDENSIPVEREPFDLSETVAGVCLAFETLLYEAEKKLDVQIEPGILYVGDPGQWKQLTSILLENALLHSEEHGKITVRLCREHGKRLRLEVGNTGTPIPPAQQARIFDRFYRTDQSRARETGGYGLGLSIAKAITQQNHGSISVKSTREETVFTVLV